MKKDSYLPRHITPLVKEQLQQMDIVAITGARKTGKTTLSRQIAQECKMSYVSLDQEHIYTHALRDSEHFIKSLPQTGVVIDEFQKVPKLANALKWFASEKQLPERLLITGSAHLFTDKTTPLYRLAGNIATVDLHPFSQGEIEGHSLPSDFIHRTFEDNFPSYQKGKDCHDLWPKILLGGYPSSILAPDNTSRESWLKHYITALTQRFVTEKLTDYHARNMKPFLKHLSLTAGNLMNTVSLGSKFKVKAIDIEKRLTLLEHLHITERIYNWDTNPMNIFKKQPKFYFLDTGIISYLSDLRSLHQVMREEKKGVFVENFAFAELTRLVNAYPDDDFNLYFYRPSPGSKSSDTEIDFILTRRRDSSVVAIEVKSASKTQPKDFKGLRYLKKRIGERLKCGVVLYTGDTIRRVDECLYAIPMYQLWSHLNHHGS